MTREAYKTLVDQSAPKAEATASRPDDANCQPLSTEKPDDPASVEESVEVVKENIADVGERRKKRVAKVIGDDEDHPPRKMAHSDKPSEEQDDHPLNTRKKKRKIKLSFDEEGSKNES